jgi:hypothetical protein
MTVGRIIDQRGEDAGVIPISELRKFRFPELAGVIALPAELVEAARDYARSAHAERAREAYARAWASFAAWCAERQLQAQPPAPEIVAV